MSGRDTVLLLFNHTPTMGLPWLRAGYRVVSVDILPGPQLTGWTHHQNDILDMPPDFLPLDRLEFAAAFVPCTHLATSGARWMRGKGLLALAGAIQLAGVAAELLDRTTCPGFIENPVSTLSTYWRKPDFRFHPHHFDRYCLADNYTKNTCLWAFNGFQLPPHATTGREPDDRIHKAPPGPDRAAFRAATPAGFSEACFRAYGTAP